MTFTPDVLVLGSGLTAVVCAFEFARRGHSVELYGEDLFGPGPLLRWATVTDRNEDLLALSGFGLAGLHDVRKSVGSRFLWATGALWVAVDSLEWAKLQLRAERLRDAGTACEVVGGGVLPAIEPSLSNSLPGGLYLPDGLTFEPSALAARLLGEVEKATFGPRHKVKGIDGTRVTFVSGETVEGGVVVCAGRQSQGCGTMREVTGTVFEGTDKLFLPVSTGSSTFGPTASGWEGVSERPVQAYQEIRRAFPAFERDDTAQVRWCTSSDGAPMIGRLGESDSTLIAAGLEGADLSIVMGAAMALSAMVESRTVPFSMDAFSPARPTQPHGAAG
ncbi:MAG: FAD-binding oxidoreductase [Armatimonadetes bacterium]|nr:FAD-binding oxidoreductase [Armatimonadota bacterium]